MSFTQGNSWELGVAIPIKNNKFYKGQYKKVVLDSNLEPNAASLVYDRESFDGLYLRNYLQYGDEITIGPSTNSENIKELEHQIVSGVKETNSDNGLIFLRDKNNTLKFSLNDTISFYGTGLAEAWHLDTIFNSHLTSEGIKKGPVSRQLIKTFASGSNPDFGEYVKNGTDPLGSLTLKLHEGDFGFVLDLISIQLDYIQQPIYLYNNEPFSKIAIQDLDGIIGDISILMGHFHKGGWRKQFAQRLGILLNASTPSNTLMYQNLIDWGDQPIAQKRRKALLIPYQFYRIGGKAFVDPISSTKVYNTDYNIFLELKTTSKIREYSTEVIKIDILNSSNANVGQWYEFSKTQLLASGISNIEYPTLNLGFTNKLDPGDITNSNLNVYLDELWVEHAGGVEYAVDDGCLKFSRYGVWPEQGSISQSKKDDNEFDTSKRVVECRIDYCPQAFWDQLELILDWQNRGYLLNLHPYIKDIGNVLTGRLYIKDLSKNSWDLDFRSFTMVFEEVM